MSRKAVSPVDKKQPFQNFGQTSRDREFPTANLGVPSNRRQVFILDRWYEEMCENLKEQKMEDHKQEIEQLMMINRFAFLELVRQIGINCSERAVLLKKVVSDFISLNQM